MSEQKAHVLWWRYTDGSGVGISRVYLDAERAEHDYELIKQANDHKTWTLTEVGIFGDMP